MITAQEAQKSIAAWDWPGAIALDAASLENQLVWIPFERHTGRNAAQPVLAEIASIRLPASVQVASLPTPQSGDWVVQPRTNAPAVYLPCWLFAADSPSQLAGLDAPSQFGNPAWVAVEATRGAIVGGRLPAASAAAVVRLWALLTMLCVSISVGSLLIMRIVAFPLSFLGGAIFLRSASLGIAAVGATLLIGGYIAYKLRPAYPAAVDVVLARGLPTWLVEPVARVDLGSLRFPLDERWLGLMRAFGVLVLLASGVQCIFAAGTWSFLSPITALLSASSVGFGFAAGLLAIFRSQGKKSEYSEESPSARPAQTVHGPSALLVASVLRVMLLGTAGFVIGGIFYYAGPRHLSPVGWLNDEAFLLSTGARSGALIGSALVPASGRTRVSLSLGAIAAWLASMWLGDWGTPLAVGAVVAFSSVPTVYARGPSSPKDLLQAVLRCTWGYSIGAIIGRLGGKMLGAALLGPIGWVVGEVVGEQVLATLGWIQTRPRD